MLIVLRGNSGSGKTTTAYKLRIIALHENPSKKIAVIEQDYLRRKILKEKETEGANNIELIFQTTSFCLDRGYDVILEGILSSKRYEPKLELLSSITILSFFYYFDIPFDETLKRHATKPNYQEFGATEMREWYHEKDLLTFTEESVIDKSLSQSDVIKKIRSETGL